MTVTKDHLASSVHVQVQLPKKRSAQIVKSLFEIIKQTLGNGEDILISRFGKFCIKKPKGKTGGHAGLGNGRSTAGGKQVAFKCSEVLKGKLNGGH